MKKKKTLTVKKALLYLFIVIIVGLYVGIQFLKSNKTPNSFSNTGYFGNSLYYDTLKELGYEVSIEIKPIENINTKGLVVLNVASELNTLNEKDYEKIFKYVKSGGRMLVLFSSSDYMNVDHSQFEELTEAEDENAGQIYSKWISEANGVLMYGSIYSTNNAAVKTDRQIAYTTLMMLHPYIEKDGVVFNEYYLYVSEGKRSLWSEIPQGLKFTIYQIIVVLFLFIGYKGRRFGAPKILYEEVEPDEHQYAKAVGGLYYRGGHYEVLIASYYKNFISKVYHKHLLYSDLNEENWITAFQNDKEFKIAKKVHSFMKQYQQGEFKQLSKKRMKSKIKEFLIHIQTLEKSLDQK
ncbi:MAG: hypothetical protein CVU84_14855 [Firmicutes bacterium HGW-Firmicutes-1]|nr:MAG: hypothetical protein CVU84_14855 [Firmicutes bacterium HGW-Firmicutes-1]